MNLHISDIVIIEYLAQFVNTMIKAKIKSIILQTIQKAFPDIEKFNFSVDYTDEKFGDYSTNVALIMTKRVAQLRQGYDGRGERPEAIAKKLTAILSKNEIFETVEVASPSFINFKIALPYLQNQILEITQAGDSYGNSDLGKDLKINVEFISANPTGPLTLGNGRGGYSGDCLANILEAFGAEVEREYYINDRGAQVVKLGHSVLSAKGGSAFGGKDDQAVYPHTKRFGEGVYRGKYIDDIASKITSKNPEKAGQEAAAIIMEGSIKKTILKMGIKFDHWFSQSALYDGEIEHVLGILKNLGFCYEKDSALWLKTSQFGDDKDRVLITEEKEFTYFASDIAYHWKKMSRGYNLLIDFWGADHHGYVKRMQAAIEILRQKNNWSGNLRILIAQLVRLMSKGQEIKMSKRLGTYVTLDELIDEVGPDVTRFFFLERALNTHMDFDLDLGKERSEKNPVYYIQYAHARIHSILAKLKMQNANLKMTNQNVKLIKEKPETNLIKELIKLPDIIVDTAEDYQVQRLPYYAIELATKFHNFYEKCRVISDDENLTAARIELIRATKIVLKKTLDLMGISSPEKM